MADPSSPAGPPAPAADAESERLFGLLLFEAEECLARGNAEKAAVHASRAVRQRPQSLTARSLLDRARRELTRGRRRERLEERVVEARQRLARGEHQAAEKIVASVLKLLPDHAAALQLFSVLKDIRLSSGTAEAEAERELDALARSRARRAAESARAALQAGWSFRALMTLRRALAVTPDDPELLALYTEGVRLADRERARRRGPRPSATDSGVLTGKFSRRAIAAGIARPPIAPARATRRPSIPIVIGCGAALLLAGVSLALLREAPAAAVEPPKAAAVIEDTAPTRRDSDEADRVFADHDPELRRAVDDVLARYGHALEAIDTGLLAQARPDISARARRDLIAHRQGATKVATDLRVLDVTRRGGQASVKVRRTEVVVAGRSVDRALVEETLRFQREGGAWVLRPSR